MNQILLRVLSCLLALVFFTAVGCAKQDPPTGAPDVDESTDRFQAPIHNIAFTELGNPTREKYPNGEYARCAWDMAIYGGKLYLGSGDYGNNLGPVAVSCYHIASGTWEENTLLPDEEINRFCLIDGKLCAPGIDPQQAWDYGNYYVLDDTGWSVKRTIPGGVHVFDIVEHEGHIFAGLGVVEGRYPVSVSKDGGETFLSVPFQKEGMAVDTRGFSHIRTYDFFAIGGELYATLTLDSTYELYIYDSNKECFVFEEDWTGRMDVRRYKQNVLGEKAVFNKKLYITTGCLYQTSDLISLTHIAVGENTVVADLVVSGDVMYVLTFVKGENEGYQTKVYALCKGETELKEVFDFVYDVPGISMVVDGNDFYIGMGKRGLSDPKNGNLIRVSIP